MILTFMMISGNPQWTIDETKDRSTNGAVDKYWWLCNQGRRQF